MLVDVLPESVNIACWRFQHRGSGSGYGSTTERRAQPGNASGGSRRVDRTPIRDEMREVGSHAEERMVGLPPKLDEKYSVRVLRMVARS